jgi:hypothetical protein
MGPPTVIVYDSIVSLVFSLLLIFYVLANRERNRIRRRRRKTNGGDPI